MQLDPIYQPIFPKPTEGVGKAKPGNTEGTGFGDVLQKAITEVNTLQQSADDQIAALMKGESQDIHSTVLAVQQADSSFKMMMSVRNKIIEAYKEISRAL